MIDYTKLKEALGIDDDTKVSVKPMSGGFKIIVSNNKDRAILPIVKGASRMHWFGSSFVHKCMKCGIDTQDIHYHHIVFRSAGGKDEPDNLLPLCYDCHVGNNAIHAHMWAVEDLIGMDVFLALRSRYGIK